MSIAANALLQYRNLAVQPPRAQTVQKGQVDKKLLNACQQFEAIFVNEMLTAMRNTVPKSGLFHQGLAQNIYEDMLYQQYSDTIAKSAHFGLARLLYDQLSVRGLSASSGPSV